MAFSNKNKFLAFAFLVGVPLHAKVVLHEKDDVKVSLSGKFSNSSDSNINAMLLNDKALGGRGEKVDRAFANKSRVELTANIKHAKGVEVQTTLRSKFGWGTPRAATTSSQVKYGEALIGSHSHDLGRNDIYIQEAWVTLDLKKFSDWSLWNQTFTAGLFPFELGKGISLGNAYLVDPISLGFFKDNTVDQFAPGVKLSGNLYWDFLEYDLYGSITNNKSSKLKDTASQIYDQLIVNGAYVSSAQFARGSGDIDWRLAGRLRIKPIDDKDREQKFSLEPYAMYTRTPSQTLEFAGDSASKMGTVGCAGEFQIGSIEFGFDTAMNLGHQDVLAWDRNEVTTQTNSTTGAVEQVYSHIYNEAVPTTKLIYTGDTTNYRPTSGITSAMNGKQIGTTGKFNAGNRFRDKYKNKYKGYMFVIDGSLFVYKRDIKVSASAGYSRGDTNPNTRTGSQQLAERTYNGFIPQQELFSGGRVKSIFVMGPAKSLTRPNPLEASNGQATDTEGFTNIMYVGMGGTWAPEDWENNFSINPNVLVYWQNKPAKKLADPTVDASDRLGTELNTCAIFKPSQVDNLKFSLYVAAFLPGKFYKDVKGTALSSAVAKLVRDPANAGVAETLPTLGNSTAFTVSAGMEYVF